MHATTLSLFNEKTHPFLLTNDKYFGLRRQLNKEK